MSPDLSQSPDRKRSRRPLFRRGFIKNRDGATLIEFALLSLPFLLLVFAILESCISYASEEYMQNVTDEIARDFRVGKLRAGTVTQAQLRTRICDRMQIFVATGCPGLTFDLQNFSTFSDASTKAKWSIDGSGNIVIADGGYKFAPGLAQSKNMLRVFYRWPVMTDIMKKKLTNLDDSTTLHFASATWQNEPFED